MDIKNISDTDIITILNEIYEWKKTGDLKPGNLKELYNTYKDEFVTMYYLEERILYEAHERFKNVVKVLIVNNPGLYIR